MTKKLLFHRHLLNSVDKNYSVVQRQNDNRKIEFQIMTLKILWKKLNL